MGHPTSAIFFCHLFFPTSAIYPSEHKEQETMVEPLQPYILQQWAIQHQPYILYQKDVRSKKQWWKKYDWIFSHIYSSPMGHPTPVIFFCHIFFPNSAIYSSAIFCSPTGRQNVITKTNCHSRDNLRCTDVPGYQVSYERLQEQKVKAKQKIKVGWIFAVLEFYESAGVCSLIHTWTL